MTRNLASLLLGLACLSGPSQAADEHVALVKSVSGTVNIVRNERRLPVQPGTVLFVADRLLSAADSAAGIVFKDGTLLTVGPAADLLLRNYAFKPQQARYDFSLYLAKGTAVYASGRIAKLAPDAVKIGTPTATVGVRGTRFIVDAQ